MPATVVTRSEHYPENFWKRTGKLAKLVEWTRLHPKNKEKYDPTLATVKAAATEKCIRRSPCKKIEYENLTEDSHADITGVKLTHTKQNILHLRTGAKEIAETLPHHVYSQQQPVNICQPIRKRKLSIWDSEFWQQDCPVEPTLTSHSLTHTKPDTELTLRKYSSLDEFSTSHHMNSLPLTGETPFISHLRHQSNTQSGKPGVIQKGRFKIELNMEEINSVVISGQPALVEIPSPDGQVIEWKRTRSCSG
ncbi:hypothetical protein BDF14DRAFT_96589 [Spinellus fusiger]|nr:hypothetical protein BDF14DRAFT_96589 [Spinellus fusiger]